MKPTDADQFRNLIRGMGRLYGTEPDALVLDAYWIALEDWTLADFETACRQLMKTAKFMPRPAEFAELRQAGRETAGEVFAGIRRYIAYSPNGYTVVPDTPRAIAAAIRAMGGADAYAMCEVDKLPFLEKRFCQHYEEIIGHEDTRQAVPEIAYGKDALQITKQVGTFTAIGKVDA